jgi:Fe-S-cluster-containing hydrogenase component 2
VAAQDQALQTKYHATKILQTAKDSKCRLCHHLEETAGIVSACPVLAKNNTSSDMIECVLNYTSIYARNWG